MCCRLLQLPCRISLATRSALGGRIDTQTGVVSSNRFADGGDERVGGNDEIARTASIASLAKTGERVMAQPYDATARAFRVGIRPTNDPNVLHV